MLKCESTEQQVENPPTRESSSDERYLLLQRKEIRVTNIKLSAPATSDQRPVTSDQSTCPLHYPPGIEPRSEINKPTEIPRVYLLDLYRPIWWRRRESNPGPGLFVRRFYVRSWSIDLAHGSCGQQHIPWASPASLADGNRTAPSARR